MCPFLFCFSKRTHGNYSAFQKHSSSSFVSLCSQLARKKDEKIPWCGLISLILFLKAKYLEKMSPCFYLNSSCSVVLNQMFPLFKTKKLAQPICPYKLPVFRYFAPDLCRKLPVNYLGSFLCSLSSKQLGLLTPCLHK